MLALLRLWSRSPRRTGCALLALSASVVCLLLFSEAVWIAWRFCAALAEFVLDTQAVRVSRDVDDMAFGLVIKGRNISSWKAGNFFNASQIAQAGFNSSWDTKIFIHGFSDRAITQWTIEFLQRYQNRTDQVNVFLVGWESLAETPWYTVAAKNARLVGQLTARMILFLSVELSLDVSSVHVIGASLGAHAAGFAGQFTGGRVGRVTGLDPSSLAFREAGPEDRLDPSDALFVDVIHTAGRWVGNDAVLGHADFYPNLGRAPQPGCLGQESFDLSCSHFRAWQIFGVSISWPNNFSAIRCADENSFTDGSCCCGNPDRVFLGENVNPGARGKYFLYTNGSVGFNEPLRSTNCSSPSSG